MAIRCPYCLFEMELKGARAGRFAPKCAACGEKFTLVVSANPKVSPTVLKALDEVCEELPGTPSVTATLEESPIVTTIVSTEPAAAAPLKSVVAAPGQVVAAPAVAAPVLSAPSAAPLPLGSGGSSAPASIDEPFVGTLGGCQIIERLGLTSTGAIYLGRKLWLDQFVTFKLLSPALSRDPATVESFLGEAVAAARLNHHGLVRIDQIGEEDGIYFVSMEFIDGEALSKVVRDNGKLVPESAAGFILQAARALLTAHSHGILHRDLKPDNLLIDSQGMIKIANLGLINRPDTSGAISKEQALSGTPAYMSPEQARDARLVDHRSDIYSLGCTFYELLTGRPPFLGSTVQQVLSKHQREAMTPPDMVIRSVPRTLSAIVLRMTAKRPEERYASMTEVIRALEDFLGVPPAGPFTPRPELAAALEGIVKKFNASGPGVLRSQIIVSFFLGCIAGIAALLLTGHPLWACTLLGVGVLTPVAYQVIVGISRRTHLFAQFRQSMTEGNLLDGFLPALLVGLLLAGLFLLGWLWQWLAAAAVAIMLGLLMHYTVDALRERDRAGAIEAAQTLLKQLRLRGTDETRVRQFLCIYTGTRWEEFYEALFGYDAKLLARKQINASDTAIRRPKFAAWRDPLIRMIERRLSRRRAARQQRLLEQAGHPPTASGSQATDFPDEPHATP